MTCDQSAARHSALAMLAQREHSVTELRRKLLSKGFAAADVEPLLTTLIQADWVSDARFTELYTAQRARQGIGPLRLREELRQRGIDDAAIAAALAVYAETWQENASRVRVKRFGEEIPRDLKTRARQSRFLAYRGFSADHIRAALRLKA